MQVTEFEIMYTLTSSTLLHLPLLPLRLYETAYPFTPLSPYAVSVLVVDPASLYLQAQILRSSLLTRCTLLVDITAIDLLGLTNHRYCLLVCTFSMTHLRAVWMMVLTSVPSVPSLASLWLSSNLVELEVFDMLGFSFLHGPTPTRVLTDFTYLRHPLAKDSATTVQDVVYYTPSSGGLVYLPSTSSHADLVLHHWLW